jgi:hypothetical protein
MDRKMHISLIPGPMRFELFNDSVNTREDGKSERLQLGRIPFLSSMSLFMHTTPFGLVKEVV